MERKCVISRGELLELLEAYYRLAALERGGVDNWQWYGEANSDFLEDYINENKHLLTEGMESEDIEEYLEDFDFNDIAEFEIGNYM